MFDNAVVKATVDAEGHAEVASDLTKALVALGGACELA